MDPISNLYTAIRNGNVPDAANAIRSGVDPDGLADSGRPFLVEAIRTGHTDIVDLLLKKGASPNGAGILGAAIERNHVEIARLLLLAGADANADCEGLHSIIKSAPLNLAARFLKGGLEMIELLVEFGADVNRVDGTGQRPLTAAVDGQQWEHVTALLILGANPVAEERSLIAPATFPGLASRSEFLEFAERVSRLTGSTGLHYHLHGAIAFPVVGLTRLRDVQTQLLDNAINSGYLLIDSETTDHRGQFLYLLPSSDPFAAMALVGINDWPDGPGPPKLIAGFRKLYEEVRFQLIACRTKSVELRFVDENVSPQNAVARLNEIFRTTLEKGDLAPVLFSETRQRNVAIHWPCDW